MADATVRCPKCGHEGIVVTELLNSDLALISDHQEAEIERLTKIIRSVIDGDWCVTELQEAIGDLSR